MIRISITHESEGRVTDLGMVRITRIEPLLDDAVVADYQVEVMFENAESTMLKQRWIQAFPRRYLSALALVKYALNEITDEELELDGEPAVHMARKQHRTLRALQAGARRLRDNRSTFRSGQSEQHGGDSRRKGSRDEDPQ